MRTHMAFAGAALVASGSGFVVPAAVSPPRNFTVLTVSVGDTVVFQNNDGVVHNTRP